MIAITGSSGLVGGALSNYLSNINHVNLVRESTYPSKQRITKQYEVIDLEKSNSIKVLDKYKDLILIHCAAKIPNSKNSFQDCYIDNTIIDKNIFDYLQDRKHHLVFISSANVYDKSSIITEESKLKIDNKYLQAKVESEDMFKRLSKDNKLTVLRINSPYHFRMKSKTVLKKFMELAFKNKPITVFGKGTRLQDFTHVYDIAKAIIQSTKQTKNYDLINIASGNSISMFDLARLVNSQFGNNIENIHFEGVEINPEKTVFDISYAVKVLDWNPKFTISDGIKQWYESLCRM